MEDERRWGNRMTGRQQQVQTLDSSSSHPHSLHSRWPKRWAFVLAPSVCVSVLLFDVTFSPFAFHSLDWKNKKNVTSCFFVSSSLPSSYSSSIKYATILWGSPFFTLLNALFFSFAPSFILFLHFRVLMMTVVFPSCLFIIITVSDWRLHTFPYFPVYTDRLLRRIPAQLDSDACMSDKLMSPVRLEHRPQTGHNFLDARRLHVGYTSRVLNPSLLVVLMVLLAPHNSERVEVLLLSAVHDVEVQELQNYWL